MVCGRLGEAGISAVPKGDLSADSRDLGAYGVYVEDVDLDRARAVLHEAESFSEDELVQAEREAVAASRARIAARSRTPVAQSKSVESDVGEPDEPSESSARQLWDRLLKRGAKRT
jgi:hypothetical protein